MLGAFPSRNGCIDRVYGRSYGIRECHAQGHDQSDISFTKDDYNPFGIQGKDYDESYPVTSEPLYALLAEFLREKV